MTQNIRRFGRTIGIDYSGAETADSSLKGLRVYQSVGEAAAEEVLPPPSPKKYWTRRGLAKWLIEQLDGNIPTIVGIDHGFSFPLRYFERYGLEPDWSSFLEDFCAHWPTDSPHTYVDFVRDGKVGNGNARTGERRWRRLTEEATGAAKSVFHFDVQGTVAKSTHAGLPWLRHIRRARSDLHFWPFDGWLPSRGSSVVVEAYPRLYSQDFPKDGRTADQHDAYSIARWLKEADQNGTLADGFAPPASEPVAVTGFVEGWILGSYWPPTEKTQRRKYGKKKATGRTTRPGYVNLNEQEVLANTGEPGNDHNQLIYLLKCHNCGERYGANGSDIFQRRCPNCDGGRPGLTVASLDD